MNGGERTEESSPGHHQREAAGCWYLPQPEGHRLPAGRSEVGEGKAEKCRTHWKFAYEVAQSGHSPPQGTEQRQPQAAKWALI